LSLIASVRENIDLLYKLSNLIRKASFLNQTKRATVYQLVDEFGNNLEVSLLEWFTVLIRREFPGLKEVIAQRLAASMILRRKQIGYRHSRQTQWRLQQERYIHQKRGQLPYAEDTASFPEPETFGAIPASQVAPTTTSDANVAKRENIPISTLTATTVDPSLLRKLGTPSKVSRGASAPLSAGDKFIVPPPPHEASVSLEFVCLYCCLVLDRDVGRDKDKWT